MAAEVPQILEYMGGQLDAAPVLEVENFTNWKNRFICHIIAGERKPEVQWTPDERKATNLDQRLKSLIMFVFPDNQMNSDFKDSPDEEEDTRSSQEYMNDLEEEYQARALLAKSKRFFKKGTQMFSSAKATDQTECYKCDEEVSSDDNEAIEVKALMALADEERVYVGKESARNGEWVKVSMKKVDTLLKMEADNSMMSIPDGERPCLFEAEDLILPNHDADRILPAESQRKTTDPPVAVTDSSAIDYDSTDKSLVCSTPLPPLEKLVGAEPISGPKSIKSILKLNFTFKAKALKGVIINKPSSAPAKGNKSSSALKINSAPASKLKNVKIEDDPPLAIVMKKLNELNLQLSKNKSSFSRNNTSQQVLQNALQNRYKTQFKVNCDLCGQNNHLSENLLQDLDLQGGQYPFLSAYIVGIMIINQMIVYTIPYIKKSERGISINQEKYVKDMLKKYDINGSLVKNPMVPPNKLGPDLNGKAINETQYKGFDLKGYSDSDYAGCNVERKSTSSACQFLGGKLVC
ncbi:hypothetical protein Tco_1482397 [Tanacetum coccineum]